MTDVAEPAPDGFDLPPYDPYAGWDAPAPYIKEVPPAQPDGLAEAIAAGLLPDPSTAPAPVAALGAAPQPVAATVMPFGAPPAPFVPLTPVAQPALAPQPAAAAPLMVMPPLPEQPLAPAGRTYELASFKRRARAMTIDSFILMIPTAIILKLIWPWIHNAIHSDTTLSAQVSGISQNPTAILGNEGRLEHWIFVVAAIATVVYWLVLAAYSGFFMSRTGGQTPGRTAAGIRVMREDGGPISFGWAVWRCVIAEQVIFTVLSLFTFGLATVAQYGWSLWDHDRRSLHDMIARSRVVVDAARYP